MYIIENNGDAPPKKITLDDIAPNVHNPEYYVCPLWHWMFTMQH